MLKTLRFIPLCVLILSGHAFSEDFSNSSSDSDAAKRAASEAAAAKVAAASGVDDLLSDLKSGVNRSKSGVGVGSYAMVIRDVIKNRLGDSLDIYKGKKCSVKIGLLRDGTVIYAVDYAGDSELC
ncbi:TPA: cell envelope integrity TolA C-terminal domain-containing protein, partial [Salmonella enterica subsp. diarizonae serovar 53:z10:z35]